MRASVRASVRPPPRGSSKHMVLQHTVGNFRKSWMYFTVLSFRCPQNTSKLILLSSNAQSTPYFTHEPRHMCHLFPQSVSHCRTLRDSGSFRGSVRLEFVSDMLVFYSALFEQSGQAPVGRFFCDAAAMQLRFGCDAKRKSFCRIIGAMTLCWRGGSLHLWLTAELEGNPCR